jgi:predicted Zn-dependent peptidase
MNYKKTTLKNGLRIITIPAKGNPAVTVMVIAEAGSKYEKKSESGLSHFIEHMCFKGTPKRPSSSVVNKELDAMGAMSNAMTSEEYTGYYAKAEKKHWKKILDVISDIYLHPNFPKSDLEKERGVILQEISMYEDQPQDKVAVLFQHLLYGDTPVGRFIAGTKESVSKLKHKNFIDYHHRHYVAEGTIVIVSGDVSETEVKREVDRLFKDIKKTKKPGKVRVVEKQTKPALVVHKKKTDQTHMVLGVRAYKASDPREPVLALLSGVLGSGMSSRLWHTLREELGACYYVYSSFNDFTDHGYFYISTGIESKRAVEITKAILSECKKLTQELVTPEELQKAKDYLVGHMYLKLETTNALAMFYAGQEILRRRMKLPEKLEEEIRAVTAKDIKRVAQHIFQNKNLNLAVVGDVDDEAELKKALTF